MRSQYTIFFPELQVPGRHTRIDKTFLHTKIVANHFSWSEDHSLYVIILCVLRNRRDNKSSIEPQLVSYKFSYLYFVIVNSAVNTSQSKCHVQPDKIAVTIILWIQLYTGAHTYPIT
jgi:hypothetical protein